MEDLIAVCPNCDEKGKDIELVDAYYSPNHLVCPECGDEFDKLNT